MIGELGDQRLIMRDDIGEFLARPRWMSRNSGMIPTPSADADNPRRSRGHGRLDIADDAAPGLKAKFRPHAG